MTGPKLNEKSFVAGERSGTKATAKYVRSSASHEDSAAASFAGQGRTILNVGDEPANAHFFCPSGEHAHQLCCKRCQQSSRHRRASSVDSALEAMARSTDDERGVLLPQPVPQPVDARSSHDSARQRFGAG